MDSDLISWVICGALGLLMFVITKPGNNREESEKKNPYNMEKIPQSAQKLIASLIVIAFFLKKIYLPSKSKQYKFWHKICAG